MMEKLTPCNNRMQIKIDIVAAMYVRGKKMAQQVVAISRSRLQSIISDIIPEKGRTARAIRGNAASPIPITDSLQCRTSIRYRGSTGMTEYIAMHVHRFAIQIR